MSISSTYELEGMKRVSEAVAITLNKMKAFAEVGMNTKELDEYGGEILRQFGANSAPKMAYGFPGYTCISVNHEIAHGIPRQNKILQDGDLINIDVSAELDGYWADNGGSFIMGNDVHEHEKLVNTSRNILHKAISEIRGGVAISAIGKLIETEAKKAGFTVIKNLVGHGVGRALHESPFEIPCYYDRFNKNRFRKHAVVAIETFISTKARLAREQGDGWTYVTGDGSFVAQHEHTIVVTDGAPLVLTQMSEAAN